MCRLITTFSMILFPLLLFPQLRNGWRSVYDKDGRLNSMRYYVDGIEAPDSTTYFQYYTDNVLKGIIKGEIIAGKGCQDGFIWLFSEVGEIGSFSVRNRGQAVFNIQKNSEGNYYSSWTDQFFTLSTFWKGNGISVSGNRFLIENNKEWSAAVFEPVIPVDLNKNYRFSVKIPVCDQSAEKIGLVIGWSDAGNWLLLETVNGTHFGIYLNQNGKLTTLTELRPIEKPNRIENVVSISNGNKNLIIEINNNIETIVDLPNLTGNKIGLLTRSKGTAIFKEMSFGYVQKNLNSTFPFCWFGVATGFLFSADGKILTAYDAIANAGSLRVKGKIKGTPFVADAEVLAIEESHNLAVLKISSDTIPAIDQNPFGFLDRRPASNSRIYTMGYPHVLSGTWLNPSLFEGRVLPVGSGGLSRMIELPFRFGLVGSPVFDDYLNLIGMVTQKGVALNYTEIIDLYDNKKIFQTLLQQFHTSTLSPYKDLPFGEKQKRVGDAVVIIEKGFYFREDL